MSGAGDGRQRTVRGICDLIPDAMARHKVPGVALVIVCESREFIGGFGVISIRHPLPVDEKTQGEFIRNPDGSIARLRWGYRIHART
jgi:hypothetical protein